MIASRISVTLAFLLLAGPLGGQVVINEIFYHAPDNLGGLQWIELHNTTDEAVNLSGWSLAKGVKLTFAPGVTLAPRGHIVVCKNRERFQQCYDVPVAGEFEKSLKRSGERLDLRNAAGDIVDTVTFSDGSPWPSSPDGESASLERICPTASSSLPENWTASPLSSDATKPGGTPGKTNAAFSANLPPIVSRVTFKPARAEPDQAITIEADVQDAEGLREVTLRYRVAGPGAEGEEKSLPMVGSGQRYSATIPGQQAGQVIRFRIQAVNRLSAQRLFPSQNEPRPALSCLVHPSVTPGKIALGYIVNTDPVQFQSMQRQRRGPGGPDHGPDELNHGPGGPDHGPGEMDHGPGGSNQPPFMRPAEPKAPKSVQGKSAFVYVDPQTREPRLFDFVRVTERSGGYKVHFAKDQPLEGMPVINVVFKMNDRWALTEPLAYELYRRAGAVVCRTDFIRLWIDGKPIGYHFLFDQPNSAFFRRSGLRDDGNLYKANWRGRGLTGQNEKKSNPQSGHDDLIQLVEQLEKTKANPLEQWELINRECDVEQMINHYAVRMLLSDWDGFFNNYYLYHDVNGTKKWTLYPWDQDQTWGDSGFGNLKDMLCNMPLTLGAEGDKPPGWKGDQAPRGFSRPGMGGTSWWRPGGYVSKPLLANPTVRALYLARIKELLNSEFTEARLFPLIDQLRDRLQDEVRFRAEAAKDDTAEAQQRFENNLASLKEFVTKRRQWLLEQEPIRAAGTFDRSQLK